MAKELFNTKLIDKLSPKDSVEAINNLETKDQQTKDALISMLHENLIEVYRNLSNPREIRIGLTKKGIDFFAQYSAESQAEF